MIISPYRRGGYHAISVIYKDKVHQEPCSPAVSIDKRVDIDQAFMSHSGKLDGVQCAPG